VPQREPLSPPLLAAACLLAAVPAAWLALAADPLVSGAVGALTGFGWPGLRLSPFFIPVAGQAWGGSHPPVLWTILLLSGPLGAALLGLGLHVLFEVVRSPAWLRVVGFEWAAFATLRVTALLVAGVAAGGCGPVNELYQRLGEPQSGRWAVAILALLALWGAARLVAALAVAFGRDWMRIDGRPFRRRLVRIIAGYPTLGVLAAWSALMPWATPLWVGAWLLLTLGAMQLLTV
jgi:hypothetical protein